MQTKKICKLVFVSFVYTLLIVMSSLCKSFIYRGSVLNILTQEHYVIDGGGNQGDYCLIMHPVNMNYSLQKDIFFKNYTSIPLNINDNLGFCTELSLAMILMYYDTYYNNNIVPSNMVVTCQVNLSNLNSIPSLSFVNNNFDYANQSATRSQYLSNAYTYQNANLLDSIICYADSNGFLSSDNLGITNSTVSEFIDEYLEDNNLLTLFNHSNQSGSIVTPTVEYIDHGEYGEYLFSQSATNLSNTYKSIICEYINNGYPVLVYLNYLVDDDFYPYDMIGHTAIAYSRYYNNGWEPVYHFGYSDLTSCWISGDYVIVGYDVIYPTTYSNHVCSTNYINANTNSAICPHLFSNHTHEFVSFSSMNAISHRKYCYCSQYVTEPHHFIEIGQSAFCAECGYSTNGNHPINGDCDENY